MIRIKYFLALSFLIFFFNSYAQDTTRIQGGIYSKELVREMFLFGKVKSIKSNDSSEKNYNQNGQLVSEIISGNSLFQFLYNLRGNVIQEVSYDDRTPTSEIIGINSYVFNQDNKLILETLSAIRWGFFEKSSYEYDGNGNLITENSYSKENQLRERNIFTYNKKDQKISQSIYDDSLQLIKKINYKYNDSGDIIDISSYDSSENLTQRYSYEFDIKHNQLKETRYQAFQSYAFEYDNFGHLIKITQDNPGYERVYKLKLDKYHNWYEKAEFVDGKEKDITKREIEYY